MGSVLLAAWISQQETTYMAAAPMAPAALPEGVGEQAGATGKGYQQVTAWQVSAMICAALHHIYD